MILRDAVEIQSSPDRVWKIVADPVAMPLWNDHVVRVTSPGSGPAVGRAYSIMYALNGKVTECTGEFTVVEPCHRLVIKVRSTAVVPPLEAEERYDLEDRNGSTLLRQQVIVTSPRVPFPLNMLIWFVMKFGKPTGKRMLEVLKDLAESGSVGAAT
ncbi:MAG: hypothetical protein A2X67_08685 [Ignavibacteria bacterium GWA2_55_11]|nr:MAG: hypothetical protein A2X67_08685 [Ignavibacteria bacterium GWA2_55_11]OGU46672.1 MAG: hypothetical protein A2X68_13390 [Ignavibacteria bacterium GWC2_56_12]OGU73809.1 MAG: hypothetical protein A3H45_14015 [Ignavibacteria bacterium RIFCSPLOWO2_02_FULL_55_14]